MRLPNAIKNNNTFTFLKIMFENTKKICFIHGKNPGEKSKIPHIIMRALRSLYLSNFKSHLLWRERRSFCFHSTTVYVDMYGHLSASGLVPPSPTCTCFILQYWGNIFRRDSTLSNTDARRSSPPRETSERNYIALEK